MDILMVFKCKNIRSMPGITNYIRNPFLVTMVTTRMHIVTTFGYIFLLPSNNMQIRMQHYIIVNISRLALGFPYTHMSSLYY